MSIHLETYRSFSQTIYHLFLFLGLTETWFSFRDETAPMLDMVWVEKAKGEACYPRHTMKILSPGTPRLEHSCAKMKKKM